VEKSRVVELQYVCEWGMPSPPPKRCHFETT